jgi:two-component system, NtrC family, response regulator AtoC
MATDYLTRAVTQEGDRAIDPVFLLSDAASGIEPALPELAPQPILIIGEPGTGKTRVALALYRRWYGPESDLVTFVCKDVEVEQFSAQAFRYSGNGHGNTPGLLLEDIGDLDFACQGELLEMLRSAPEMRPRVIATSRKNLEPEVQAGRFREDLFYGLSAVSLHICPLRHRKREIEALTDWFLARYSALFQRPMIALSREIRSVLNGYSWPGNVAELENTIRIMVASSDEELAIERLRRPVSRRQRNGAAEPVSLKQATRAATRQVERELILKVLTRTNWNRKRAAAELQISYKALLYKLKKTGIGDFAKQERA